MPLNEAQARAVATAFMHVATLLDPIDRLAGKDRRSPLLTEQLDVTPGEIERLADCSARAQRLMMSALQRLGARPAGSPVSARWTLRTALLSADIVLSDLNARTLARYGPVDAAAAAEVDAMVVEVRAALRAGEAQLSPAVAADADAARSDSRPTGAGSADGDAPRADRAP